MKKQIETKKIHYKKATIYTEEEMTCLFCNEELTHFDMEFNGGFFIIPGGHINPPTHYACNNCIVETAILQPRKPKP